MAASRDPGIFISYERPKHDENENVYVDKVGLLDLITFHEAEFEIIDGYQYNDGRNETINPNNNIDNDNEHNNNNNNDNDDNNNNNDNDTYDNHVVEYLYRRAAVRSTEGGPFHIHLA